MNDSFGSEKSIGLGVPLPMSKTKQTTLFDEQADADQLRGYETKDEREYRLERKRIAKAKTRAKQPIPKAPATGPACLRCVRWGKPLPGNELGRCMRLVVLTERVPRLQLERGMVLAIEEADRSSINDWSYLQVGEAFSCSAYQSADDRRVA